MEALEKRIQALEDLEAIKQLKYKYALCCDRAVNEKDPMPLLDVFTEDAVWDVGGFGVYEGKTAIKETAMAVLTQQIKFTYHFFSQPMITIDGDTATGKWYLWALYTMADGNDMVLAGYEDETYRKVDGEWLISSVKLGAGCFAPLQQGWGPQVTGQQG
jgi:uncharacterized protein (TIGR02246 family)